MLLDEWRELVRDGITNVSTATMDSLWSRMSAEERIEAAELIGVRKARPLSPAEEAYARALAAQLGLEE